MTATPDVLDDLVEGRTYQLHTAPDGLGGIRWQLMRFQRHEGVLAWLQVATRTTTAAADADYHAAGLNWMWNLGYDPDAMDVILILPDGIERLRPDAVGD